MGTVISLNHLQRIEAMMKRTKGTLVAGGHRMIGKSDLDGFDFFPGSFFPPTVVTEISSNDELWKEEIFGPVVVIKRFLVWFDQQGMGIQTFMLVSSSRLRRKACH